MDNSSSERSPSYTDSSPGSFGQMKFWESDVSTTTSQRHKPMYPLFGLDHVKEIEGLVEDKDVASKAVTFVVNGTRKGVVRLCADVACLMRVRKRLEQTVEKQRRELEHLRSLHDLRVSTRTSRSTSPTLPSANSDETNSKKITPEQSMCSRCSPASSYISSPHLSQSFEQSLTSLQSKEDSQQIEDTTHCDLFEHQQVIRAEVHPVPGGTTEVEKEMDRVTNDIEDDDDQDDDSDPVTIVEPAHLETLQTDFKLQTKLETELETARKEIQELRLQLKTSTEREHENAQSETAHEMSHEVAHQIACEMACKMNVVDETRQSFSSGSSSVSLPRIRSSSSQSSLVLVTQTSSDLQHSCNCHCAKCTENKEEEISKKQTNYSASITEEMFALEHRSKRCRGHSVPVQLNDRVVIRGGRIGHIRYIGALNHGNSNTKNPVYLGLQLEEPHGHHDGIHNGKRYFWCHRNHGIFIPIQDVLSVIKAKSSRPQTVRSQRSTDSGGSKTQHKREKSGNRNRVGPALLPTPPTSAKPKKEFLAGT